VKGYALIEYATEKEAREAIKQLDGSELLTQKIQVRRELEVRRGQPRQIGWEGAYA
jgi:RNA recognition motif-containing protein